MACYMSKSGTLSTFQNWWKCFLTSSKSTSWPGASIKIKNMTSGIQEPWNATAATCYTGCRDEQKHIKGLRIRYFKTPSNLMTVLHWESAQHLHPYSHTQKSARKKLQFSPVIPLKKYRLVSVRELQTWRRQVQMGSWPPQEVKAVWQLVKLIGSLLFCGLWKKTLR